MTLFAGAYALQSAPIAPTLKTALRTHLRSQADGVGAWQVFDEPSLYLIKWDSGAYPSPAWRAGAEGCSAIAGDPILLEAGYTLKRQTQLERLAPINAAPRHRELALCRGSFAFAHFVASASTLHLSTDALGLRPIYYVIQNNCLIFATALRVLEAMPQIMKQLSTLGMAELSAFSFPLGKRTPYENISVLRECEILSASPAGISMSTYEVWLASDTTPLNATDAAAHLHTVFRESVAARLAHETRVYSFLSGGMDSRAIVATLIDMGQQVEALNFSSEASQDQHYAQSFSQQAGATCRLHCLAGGVFPNFSLLALAAKSALESSQDTQVDRPQFIWSGDGGSVGLGHVYLNDRMLDAGEAGDTDQAIRHFLDFNGIALSSQVFTAAARASNPETMFAQVRQDIMRYPRGDFGRQLYFFLLFNDQRRHLFKHFETIDQHGLELLTPFFDTQFLLAVSATPARWGVAHRLYSQFFEHLPAFALRTPWQTYPGHQACPVPGNDSLSYQWAPSQPSPRPGLRERSRVAHAMLKALDHQMQPSAFSSTRIRLAALLHALGLRNCEHVLTRLMLYQLYQSRTQASSPTQL